MTIISAGEDGINIRETGELTIDLPALSRPEPSELLRPDRWLNSVAWDTSPIAPVTLVLVTALQPYEGTIKGPELKQRLTRIQSRLLGFQHQQWLLEHQNKYPALRELFDTVHIIFPGVAVQNEDGHCFVPCCVAGSKQWMGLWRPLDDRCNRCIRLAIARR